jgi:2'-5' RNA ligase
MPGAHDHRHDILPTVSRLVIVLPLLPLRVGIGFSLQDWPLHLTVAPTFVIGGDDVDSDIADVVAAVTPTVTEQPSLTVRAGSDAGFGHSGKIPVTLIEETAELSRLHQRLLSALLAIGAVFDDPEYAGQGYRPHVTVTRLARVSAGEPMTLRQAAVVDMAPSGDGRLRRVVWVRALG